MKNLINLLKMNINDILLLIIIVLLGVILVFGIYFIIVFSKNKNKQVKSDNIFNPKNLVEEESLLNVLDRKKNRDFLDDEKKDCTRFLNDNEDAIKKATETLKKETNINPFNVDLTRKDNTQNEDTNKNGKFF